MVNSLKEIIEGITKIVEANLPEITKVKYSGVMNTDLPRDFPTLYLFCEDPSTLNENHNLITLQMYFADVQVSQNDEWKKDYEIKSDMMQTASKLFDLLENEGWLDTINIPLQPFTSDMNDGLSGVQCSVPFIVEKPCIIEDYEQGAPTPEPVTVTITSPITGEEFEEGTDITVSYSLSTEEGITDVALEIDGSEVQRKTVIFDAFLIEGLDLGAHEITLKAYDGLEELASDSVNIVVEAPAQELLLDLYPNTDGESWSLMQINSNYNGNILELRRDDNDTMLVQFDAGQLPQAAIAAWAGTGKAYVTKWDGQSGNGLFVQQTNAANQPWIYDNGFALEGGQPTMIFAGNQYLDGGDILDPSLRPLYTFAIATVDEDDSTIYSKSQTGAPPIPGRWAIYHSLNALTLDVILETDEVLSIMGINPNITMNNRLLYSQESNNCHIVYINNLLEIEDLSVVSNVEESLFPFRIGSYSNPNPVRFLTGTIQAIHIYLNDVSAQRSAISTEIMNRYGIS